MARSDNPLLRRVDSLAKIADVETTLVSGEDSGPAPFITIAIPTFQRPSLLREALDSALAQKSPICDYEVIVVDNDPDPESETGRLMAGCDDPRLRYYRNGRNVGLFSNWNRCFELARGEWVALLHDDDLLNPGYLNVMVAQLRRRPRAGAIMANFEVFDQRAKDGDGSPSPGASGDSLTNARLTRIRPAQAVVFDRNVYGAPTCGSAFRRDLVLTAGGFDDDCPSADWFFTFRFNHDHPVYRTVAPLGSYRVAQNMSLRPETLRSLVEDARRFRLENARHSLLGRLVATAFGPEQHFRILQMVKTLEGAQEFDWHRYDDLEPFRKRLRQLALYRRLLGVYDRVKALETRLFG